MRIFWRIPVKLDRNAFQSTTEVGFWPVEKAEHQGCCGRIPPESGWNRNPALDSGPPQKRNKNRNVPPRSYGSYGMDTSPCLTTPTKDSFLAVIASFPMAICWGIFGSFIIETEGLSFNSLTPMGADDIMRPTF